MIYRRHLALLEVASTTHYESKRWQSGTRKQQLVSDQKSRTFWSHTTCFSQGYLVAKLLSRFVCRIPNQPLTFLPQDAQQKLTKMDSILLDGLH